MNAAESYALRIVEAGWATTIQDAGRVGRGAIGVPVAGPVDAASHAVANRLVGNSDHRAAFETAGGLIVQAVRPIVVADTSTGRRSTLGAGETFQVARHPARAWSYLAVRGGVHVEPVLGSASHDTLSGLGPPPVDADCRYAIGPDPGSELAADLAPVRQLPDTVRVWPGPHVDRFVGGLAALTGRRWTIGDDVSRVGARLRPGPFTTIAGAPTSIPSAGLVPGAVQVTPGGEPIVMLCNHPTTGGYPVVAVVDPLDLPVVAQSRPGDQLRFRAVRR
ncbi:MAG: biotin-dependent carboxyltransferase family protein [Actinomycetota bacterium]